MIKKLRNQSNAPKVGARGKKKTGMRINSDFISPTRWFLIVKIAFSNAEIG
jgi:hypothetical protein